VAPDGELMAVPIMMGNQEGDSRMEVGSPVSLFPTRILASGTANSTAQYAVSRDGRFLISQPGESTSSPITLILNWKPPASEITR
jgi:hypothetical protein